MDFFTDALKSSNPIFFLPACFVVIVMGFGFLYWIGSLASQASHEKNKKKTREDKDYDGI